MNIGIYNPRAGTKHAGGTETFLREIIKRSKHEITLFTGEGKLLEEVQYSDINVVQIPVIYKENKWNKRITSATPLLGPEIESLTMFLNVLKNYREEIKSVDVLSTHYYMDNLLISRTFNIPTLFRFPGIKAPSIRWKVMLALDDPDMYVSNSESTRRRLNEWFGVNPRGVVYAGVDTDRFEPSIKPVSENPIILFVGRIDEGKGIPDLIRAFQMLPNNFRLRIVGDGNKFEEYEQIAENSLSKDSFEFVGSVEHSAIPDEYRLADVFCLPSHHESFGMVNIEAMASGTPVVTTRIDAIEEYIEHGYNGFLVQPGDSTEIASSIRTLVNDSDLYQSIAEAAVETAQEFSWNRQVKQFDTLYEEVKQKE